MLTFLQTIITNDPCFIRHKTSEETSLNFDADQSIPYYNDRPITKNEVVLITIQQCKKIHHQDTTKSQQFIYKSSAQMPLITLHRSWTKFFNQPPFLMHGNSQSLSRNKDAANPLSYNPISLVSTLNKILERILNRRLTWHLEANNLWNPYQYGGRKNRSSTMALAELDALIYKKTPVVQTSIQSSLT